MQSHLRQPKPTTHMVTMPRYVTIPSNILLVVLHTSLLYHLHDVSSVPSTHYLLFTLSLARLVPKKTHKGVVKGSFVSTSSSASHFRSQHRCRQDSRVGGSLTKLSVRPQHTTIQHTRAICQTHAMWGIRRTLR